MTYLFTESENQACKAFFRGIYQEYFFFLYVTLFI